MPLDRKTKITPHFGLYEFDRPLRKVKNKLTKKLESFPAALYPDEWVKDRLTPLCETLEVIREALKGRPIDVGSGFRDLAYNLATGSQKTSQHVEGRAADITVPGVSALVVHATVLRLYSEGKLPHLGGLGLYNSFVHVDVRQGKKLAQWDERTKKLSAA